VVVNLAEGEPASWKDSVLASVAPHLILDGALLAAGALRARRVSVVVPADRPGVHAAVRSAIEERRRRDPVRWRVHEVRGGFVSGQAHAVVELLSGRQNLPVTSWEPVAVRGVKGRPTLLCNAETYAALAAGLSHQEAVPTQLLTIDGDGSRPRVLEVAVGTSWRAVLAAAQLAAPVLVGGYHGSWVGAGGLEDLVVCRDAMTDAGAGLGAGVVLPLVDGCPLHRTAQLTSYLARQSARRCGPCLNGLPALAEAVHELDLGRPSRARADHLVARVRGRGACGHPDGTARLVTSLLSTWPDEHLKHATGRCSFRPSRASVPLERGRVVRR
jgi:NADH:ubiquinone oxidoreductase subunit F (NADH-binding)